MKQRETIFEFIDGVRVPPTVVAGDRVIHDHVGPLVVESGTLVIEGQHRGSLLVEEDAQTIVRGTHQGSITVENRGHVTVLGKTQGSVTVARGASFLLERTGTQQGSLTNDGHVVLRGRRGGSRSGSGEFRVEGGTEVAPTVKNGITYYEW